MRLQYFFKRLQISLRLGYIPSSGRNYLGTICVHHRGSQSKRKSYFVDFFRRVDSFCYILKIFKTPFYTAFLGYVTYLNGLSSYILLPDGVSVGSRIYMGSFTSQESIRVNGIQGSSLPMSYINLFGLVSNVELAVYNGGILSRAAGTSLVLTSKVADKVLLKSKSGWNFLIPSINISSVGMTSNVLHCFGRLGKAGKARALGIRPTVRGVAMNPCDHPHGGGEGRKSPLVAAKSP
jgi:large subunit ribosomal protein L2